MFLTNKDHRMYVTNKYDFKDITQTYLKGLKHTTFNNTTINYKFSISCHLFYFLFIYLLFLFGGCGGGGLMLLGGNILYGEAGVTQLNTILKKKTIFLVEGLDGPADGKPETLIFLFDFSYDSITPRLIMNLM